MGWKTGCRVRPPLYPGTVFAFADQWGRGLARPINGKNQHAVFRHLPPQAIAPH